MANRIDMIRTYRKGGKVMKLIYRELYMNKIIHAMGTPDIKVITGVRRSGKSKLLEAFSDYIKKIFLQLILFLSISICLSMNPFLAIKHCMNLSIHNIRRMHTTLFSLMKCRCVQALKKRSMGYMPRKNSIFISPDQMLFY